MAPSVHRLRVLNGPITLEFNYRRVNLRMAKGIVTEATAG